MPPPPHVPCIVYVRMYYLRTPSRCCFYRDHLREFPLEMIFNIVYHTPDTITRTPEADADGSNGDGLSVEVQMAWGGSSTYNFQVMLGSDSR